MREVGGSNSFSVGGELFSSVRAQRNKRYSLSWPKNDSLVFVFLLSMLIRCGMQVMNMVVWPCQGCQSHLFTYKAYLMPSNQTTNQLTSDKRKCFFFLFPALPLCLLFSFFSPFFCFSHNATNMRTEKERRTKRAKVKVFCKVFAYRRLLLSSSVRWVTHASQVDVVVVVVFAAGSQAERIHALQSGTPYITLPRSSRELRSITCHALLFALPPSE